MIGITDGKLRRVGLLRERERERAFGEILWSRRVIGLDEGFEEGRKRSIARYCTGKKAPSTSKEFKRNEQQLESNSHANKSANLDEDTLKKPSINCFHLSHSSSRTSVIPFRLLHLV